MNIFDIFKKPVTKPLPIYPEIALGDIPAASTILFYGVNKLTEMIGNRLYHHPYKPPSGHAAFFVGDYFDLKGVFLNVGKFRSLEFLSAELKSTRRIDIIIYPNLDPVTRTALARLGAMDTSKPRFGLSFPDYAWSDYLRFGFRFLRPSKKEFCSENVVDIFAKEKVQVSAHAPVDTAPWDLLEWAEANPGQVTLRTLWTGSDFKNG